MSGDCEVGNGDSSCVRGTGGGIPELALHLISSALSRIVHTVLLAGLAFVCSYACELLIAELH